MEHLKMEKKQLSSLLNEGFVENLREFQCDRCNNKSFEQYVANCGHQFCHNCKRLFGDGSRRWKCKQCGEYITTVNKQDVEFGERLKNQEVYCSNKNYGYEYKDKLKNLTEHNEKGDVTKNSTIPIEITTTEEIEKIWVEIMKMKQGNDVRDTDIDSVITNLKHKKFTCSTCMEIEKKFENFNVETKQSIDGLNEKFNDIVQRLNKIQSNNSKIEKEKIETMKMDLEIQKTITELQVGVNKLTQLQIKNQNRSFDEFKNTETSSDQRMKSKIEDLEEKIKVPTDQNKLQIIEAKEQIEKQQQKNTYKLKRLNEEEPCEKLENHYVPQMNSNIGDIQRKLLPVPKVSSEDSARDFAIQEASSSKISSAKEYNIILLGETGTGKSSFINSFANYSQFGSLTEAILRGKPITLIPSKFNFTDKYDVDHVITVGENDGNERTELGKSFTINCKSYKFQFQDVIVRLIDTPGVGDTEGEKKDGKHVENILSFINNFDNLHAIGIVLKNNETKMTDRFTYCLTTLLTNLNKTAMDNIVFILTFSQGNDFEPGPVKNVIKLFIENELKESNLALNKSIMYCVDNGSYEYLIAAHQGKEIKPSISTSQNINWKESATEMSRFMSHISKLTPHKVKDSMSLNDARNFIKVIKPFLKEVRKNIKANRNLLKEYQTNYKAEDTTIKNTESNIELRQINLKIINLNQAITYCKSKKCSSYILNCGQKIKIYAQNCCEGCTVPIGLGWFCAEINFAGYCKKCSCHIEHHKKKFYKTEMVYSDVLTPEAKYKIDIATSAKEKWDIRVKEIEEREKQLEFEQTTIENAEKKFAKFLQTNTLAKPPKTKSREVSTENKVPVMSKYESNIANIEEITIEEVYHLKDDLINLPIHGRQINKILSSNATGLRSDLKNTEKVNYIKKSILSLLNRKV